MGLGLLRQRILIGKEPDLKSGDGRKATARSSRAAVATCPRSSAGRASDFPELAQEVRVFMKDAGSNPGFRDH